jgi:ribosomal protein uL24
MRVIKGDTVKIMIGGLKGKTGKVERIDTKKSRVYITGIEILKKDGSKALYPIKPSNLMIQELNLGDKRRLKRAK